MPRLGLRQGDVVHIETEVPETIADLEAVLYSQLVFAPAHASFTG